VPTHHSNVSKPLTGDLEQDIANSRHKRIYMASTFDERRAQNTQPFLLQTNARDTGEVLSDLSLPIYVNGKHWGAYITGFDPKILLED
jgi:methyl-accepting chemotaxis protein